LPAAHLSVFAGLFAVNVHLDKNVIVLGQKKELAVAADDG